MPLYGLHRTLFNATFEGYGIDSI